MNTWNDIKGDLLQATSGHIIHGCNMQGKMRSGVAKVIRAKYPKAYDAYKYISETTGLFVGQAIWVKVSEDLVIWNLITQEFYGRDGKLYLDYQGLETALQKIVINTPTSLMISGIERTIHTPEVGCGLAGGEWSKVEPIIKNTLLDTFNVNVYRI